MLVQPKGFIVDGSKWEERKTWFDGHQGVSEFVYISAKNPKIPPKMKTYKFHKKLVIRYNVTTLKSGILESIKHLWFKPLQLTTSSSI
jgi:hypothetical protein